MSLLNKLEQWDGVHTEQLIEAYGDGSNQLINQTITLTANPKVEVAATWLLKHHIDSGGTLSDRQSRDIVSVLQQLDHWAARLHILQILESVTVQQDEWSLVESFCRSGIGHDGKFVRAWSFRGLALVAENVPDLKPEVIRLCEDAIADEAASVKVQLRRALKKLDASSA